ncbi:MAG: Histidyl-tRNA synthetase [Pseudomonadota bacterium]|jgi:histidyl-tRNA synthetase
MMSSSKLQPVRGTKDLFGEEIKNFNHIVNIARKNSEFFNFEELQTPIFEFSEIFERNLGEASDIIAKEVYKFKDRSDNFLTLRPEFTAGIVRALIANGELLQILPRKFFSFGPIFRYDRPQKGRQRQFHQINFEVFGDDSYYMDVEMILLANVILRDLGIIEQVKLEINSLGCSQTKIKYEQALSEYFLKYKNDLSLDSQMRLEKNPLRILDSKDVGDIDLLAQAPLLSDFYETSAQNRFESVINLLEKFSVKYHINQRLVRGLDYYTSTVFEFSMFHEGAQNAVLAGGRYDDLVEKMSSRQVKAIGFAGGIERLMLLSKNNILSQRPIAVNYISENEKLIAFEIVDRLRKSGFVVDFCCDGNFKKQMKKASQNNSQFVVIIGEEELKNNEVVVKDFDNAKEQRVKQELLIHYLKGKL